MSERADVGVSERSERADVGVSGDAAPVLRIVRGEPTAAELAALLVVVLTRTEPAPWQRSTPGWSHRGSRLRQRLPLRTGSGAWRTSALP